MSFANEGNGAICQNEADLALEAEPEAALRSGKLERPHLARRSDPRSSNGHGVKHRRLSLPADGVDQHPRHAERK
jgi:hypothetical protein